MEKYNLDKLVKVVCKDYTPTSWYTFKKEKRVLGLVVRDEGIYNVFGRSVDIPEYHTVAEGIVYRNPHVILSYEGDYEKTYIFDTHKEAEKFAEGILSMQPNKIWIN
jgi:hypothetical protein